MAGTPNEQPDPTGMNPLLGQVPNAAPDPAASTAPATPVDDEAEQRQQARIARSQGTAARNGKPRGEGAAPEAKPAAEGESTENYFAKYDNGPQDDGVALLERARLNRQEAFYRGTLAGSSRLAVLANLYETKDGPDVTPERKKANDALRDEYETIVGDLAAHDEMKPWGTTLEGASALGGQLAGSMISPESWLGWGAKGANWMLRATNAGLQQALIQTAVNPVVQGLDIQGGVQKDIDWNQAVMAQAMGLGIGAGGHLAGELLGHGLNVVGQHELRKQIFDLSKMDPAFGAPRIAMWRFDPRNGIEMPVPERPGMPEFQPRETPAIEPRAPEDIEKLGSYADAVKTERERLWNEEMHGNAKRGKSSTESDVSNSARLTVMKKEVPDYIERAEGTYGISRDDMTDIARLYRRAEGQDPKEAFEQAANRWVEAQERGARHEHNMMESEDLDHNWMKAHNPEALALGEIYTAGHDRPVNHEDIPFGQHQEGQPDQQTGGQAPPSQHAQGGEGRVAPGGGGEDAGRYAGDGGHAGADERRAGTAEGQAEAGPEHGRGPAGAGEQHGGEATGVEQRWTADDQPTDAERKAIFKDKRFIEAMGGKKNLPHLESPVAHEVAKGWADGRAGLPPDERRLPKDLSEFREHGYDPRQGYLEAYVAARNGETMEIRATKARAVVDEIIRQDRDASALKTEKTAQGDQTLLPGVEPVSDRERLDAQGRKPLQGGDAGPAKGGLFDEDAGRQIDIVDRAAEDSEELASIAQRRKSKGGGLTEEQARPQAGVAKSAEAITAPSPEQQVAVRSLQGMALRLADMFGVPIRQGRIQMRDALGTYKWNRGVVRTREVPDFEVAVHEVGHYMENKIGQPMTDLTNLYGIELAPMVSNSAAYDPKDYVREGFAEFVRRYVGNPEGARRAAPAFYDAFQTYMKKFQPAMLDHLNEAQATYRAYLDAPSVDAVAAVRRSVDDDPSTFQKIKDVWKARGLPGVIKSFFQEAFTASGHAYGGVLDQFSPMGRAVRAMGIAVRDRTGVLMDLKGADNPEILMRMGQRAQQATIRDLMDGMRPYHEIMPEGPALADAVTEAIGKPDYWGKWDEGAKRNFDSYLIARRAEYLWEKFKDGRLENPPVAFSHADATQAISDYEHAYPAFRHAGSLVHEYTKRLMKKAYEGNLIPADLFDRLMEDKFYVPFRRDMTDKPTATGGAGGEGDGPGTTEVVKGIRGSSRDILSPLESIMGQTYLVNRTIQHNDIVLALRNLARKAGKEGGRYFEDIPATEARKYTADLEQAITNRAREIGMDPDEAQNLIAALGDPMGGSDAPMGSYFKMEQTSAHGEPIVFYREGGQLKAGRVMSSKDAGGLALYELLTAAPSPVTDIWLQAVGTLASVKRSGIITNPTFAITNYLRDQVAASILRTDYIPVWSGLKGIREEWRQGQNAVLYGYAGGVAGGAATGAVEHAAATEIDALAKKGFVVNRLTSVKGLLELSAITEAGTRNSIFGKVFEQSKARGLSDYEALIEGAFQAQDMLDFSRHGSHTRAVTRLFPFLNAHMQGLDKARRTMIDPLMREVGFLGGEGKVFQKDTAEFNNALATWLKFGAVGGGLGAMWAAINWDKEGYRDANPYFKGTHLVVPFGNRILVVPKPFELGVGFTAGEYAFHALHEKDPRAAAQFIEAAWNSLSPPDVSKDIPGVSTAWALATGKSGFTGGDIVPQRYQRLPSNMQFDDRTSEIAKWMGQQTGMSPMKIEYAIGDLFGTWGRDVMASLQGVTENSPAASLDDMFFSRRFVKDPTRSSETTLAFWKYMSATTGKYNQDVAAYDTMVRDATTRGQPLTEAQEFLAKLPAGERSYVTLHSAAKENGKPAFDANEKRLHPLQHAYDAVIMLSGLRRELASNEQTAFGTKGRIMLNPEQRRDLIQNIRMLGQMEMRNAFTIMGEAGYAGRPMYDPHEVMDRIEHISPVVAAEIATRYATNKIYTTQSVQRAWPRLRDELVRYGSDAQVRELAFDARVDGYEFSGTRARKPGVTRAPIQGAAPPR